MNAIYNSVIKRAIIEGAGCHGDKIVDDKLSHSAYTVGGSDTFNDSAIVCVKGA